MIAFKTQEYVVCCKCQLKITEHYNGWNFHQHNKPLNTYEAYKLWSKFNNNNDMAFFKNYVNSLLTNPNAMKY